MSTASMYRHLAIAAAIGLALLCHHEVSAQTTQASPISPNDPDFVMKAAAVRALASRSHHRGGAGPAQQMAAQQMAAQQMMIRQQQVAAQSIAAKRAEKKAKVRAAAEEKREKKVAQKKGK